MNRPAHPFDRATIETILPHRKPFLFVDRIVDYEPDRWIVGVKLVSRGERYLCPDPPHQPALPAAILMEAMAQVGALLVLGSPAHRGKLAVVTRVERARYRAVVRAGDEVVMRAVIDRVSGAMGKVSGSARVGHLLVASGTMLFALVPRDLQPEALRREV